MRADLLVLSVAVLLTALPAASARGRPEASLWQVQSPTPPADGSRVPPAPPGLGPEEGQSDGEEGQDTAEPDPTAPFANLPIPDPEPTSPQSPDTQSKRLDTLFAELKRQSSAETAARTAQEIEVEWSRSGSATVDLMLFWAGQAVSKDDAGAALDLLDQAILLKPDCAEAWNRRATVNYTLSDYGKSLADIERVLAIEPRHFGALMGLGMILEETDRKKQALDTYMKVLDIYPTLKSAQDAAARLSDEVSGQGI